MVSETSNYCLLTYALHTNAHRTAMSENNKLSMSSPKEVKKVRSTSQQLNFLTDYMAQHSEFAAGRFVGPQGAQKNRETWQKLAEHLAELGPVKSAEQWKTTWRDLKCKSRARNANRKRAALSTGNTAKIPALTDITQKVMNIIGRASSEGSGLPESSIGEGPEEVVLEIEYSNEQHETSADLDSGQNVQEATGLRSKSKRRKSAATPDVGSRMAAAQEAYNDTFKELVGVLKNMSGIFERYTATQEERVRLLRHQLLRPTSPLPSTSHTSPDFALHLESESEED